MYPVCVRCHQAVTKNSENYALFEQMHWLCFHLEFEHESDPDKFCGDPSCPWWHIEVLRRYLEKSGQNPDKIIEAAIKERWNL